MEDAKRVVRVSFRENWGLLTSPSRTKFTAILLSRFFREATTASRGTPMKVPNALFAGASSRPEIVSFPGAFSRPLLTSDCKSRSRVPFRTPVSGALTR